MKTQYNIISNEQVENTHREIFRKLLAIQGKVTGDLSGKADRCRYLCIVSVNDNPVSIGAIKPATNSAFSVEKANLPTLQKDFDWELGYLFTLKEHRGKGIASNVVRLLIETYGNSNLMASTEISSNPSMVRILESNGFRQYGLPWKSSIHEHYIALFLKFA